MKIIFNGESHTTESQNLADFLNEVQADLAASAVAINQEFVPRSHYTETLLQEGDQLELLVPMQGG